MINIFVIPPHTTDTRTSGVDFVRLVQPMKYLSKHPDFNVHIWNPKEDSKEPAVWDKICQEYDIIYFSYVTSDVGFAEMGMFARKHGVKLVMDMDDALWLIKPDNSAYEAYKKGSRGWAVVSAITDEVDAVTTTNGYLRNVICNYSRKTHKQVKVFPNYIDLDFYKHTPPFKDTLQITLTHFGSSSHFKDLATEEFNKGIDKLFSEYPNVVFKTIGAMLSNYRERWGARYIHGFGDADLYTWVNERFPKMAEETDIFVTPLTDDTYNRCKSSIKFLEASSTKKPGVWQKIRQYEEVVNDGENGFLAYFADEWYAALKKLIDDKELRQTMGQKAYDTVVKDWQIKNAVEDYAKFFIDLLTW